MKRDQRLRRLSDDHHQALVLARRATTAATSGQAEAITTAWNEVVRRFHDELLPHFLVEERYLLPAVERAGHGALARRTREDHAALRRLVSDDRHDLATRLGRFGALLRDHVRFEERVLFPAIQDDLDDAVLDTVADACRDEHPVANPIKGAGGALRSTSSAPLGPVD